MLIVYITVPSVLVVLLAAAGICYFYHKTSTDKVSIKVTDEFGQSVDPHYESDLQRFEREHLSEIT